MARLTKTCLILVLAASCSTTALAQNEVPPIFPPSVGQAIDRNAQKTAAPFKMMPVYQTSTPARLSIGENTELQPTQLPPTLLQPILPGQAVAQPPQPSLADIANHNSTVLQGPPPADRSLPNALTLNQPPNEQLEFGTVMMFPAQNVAQPNVYQPNVAQPNVAQPNVAQPNVTQPNVDPSDSIAGQTLPPRYSLQNLAQPRTPGNSPFKLASSPYPPNRHLTRPEPGIYVAPISQPPELTEPPPVEFAPPQPVELTEPPPGEFAQPQPVELTEPPPVEFAQPQPVELAQPQPNRFVLPQMSDFPPLPTQAAPAAQLSHVLETSVIGPEMLVRDVPDVFEIVVLNTSEQTATNIVIQLTVSKDLTVTELDRKAWMDGKNRTVSWSIGELSGGAKEVIRYSAVSGKPGRHAQGISVGMQNSFQGQTNFESVVIQNDDHETIEHPGFEDE